MDIGVFFFPTHYSVELTELATELEQRGFESLLTCEHTHIPVSRKTPFPGGGEVPKQNYHTYDPFVALSFAAFAWCRNMTRSTWRNQLLASIGFPVGDSFSALAAAGTWMRWRTTGLSIKIASR